MTKPPYTGRGSGSHLYHHPRIHITWDQVVPDYRRGLTSPEIAKKLNVSCESVRRALRHFGETIRPRGAGGLPPNRNPFWRGGKQPYKDKGQKYWAAKIATFCFGQALPHGSVIHHIDENNTNNDPTNLILFSSNADHLRTHYQLSQLPQPVSKEDAIRVASENGGQRLRRPYALVGWKLDRVPPVLSGSPKIQMPDPTGFRWGRRLSARQ